MLCEEVEKILNKKRHSYEKDWSRNNTPRSQKITTKTEDGFQSIIKKIIPFDKIDTPDRNRMGKILPKNDATPDFIFYQDDLKTAVDSTIRYDEPYYRREAGVLYPDIFKYLCEIGSISIEDIDRKDGENNRVRPSFSFKDRFIESIVNRQEYILGDTKRGFGYDDKVWDSEYNISISKMVSNEHIRNINLIMCGRPNGHYGFYSLNNGPWEYDGIMIGNMTVPDIYDISKRKIEHKKHYFKDENIMADRLIIGIYLNPFDDICGIDESFVKNMLGGYWYNKIGLLFWNMFDYKFISNFNLK